MKTLCFILTTLLIVSCSTQQAPTGNTPAEALFKEAERLKKKSRYIMAQERLNAIKSQYPYSFYATFAELLLADILYEQENFVEAASAYLLFRDFHPKHKKLSYVIWRIAESYYKQLPDTFDRDLTAGHEAIKYYREILQKFPVSEQAKSAREKIKVCTNMFNEKEKYIADFYFKTDVFDSARLRYLGILENFKNKKINNHSMLRVVKSSQLMESYTDCIKYADQYKNKIDKDLQEDIQDLRSICVSEYKKIIPKN